MYVCSDAVDSINSSIDARGQGFIRACKTMGASHDFKWRVVSVPRGKTFADSALTALLALDEFPDAICCQMDMMAIPLVLRLERYGHHTPSDYSIIGFDDSPVRRHCEPDHHAPGSVCDGSRGRTKWPKLIEGKPLENAHEIVRAQLVLRRTDSVYGTGR